MNISPNHAAQASTCTCSTLWFLPRCIRSKRFRVSCTLSNGSAGARPQVSERVTLTDAPIIVKTKQYIGGRTDVLSLAQGKCAAWVKETQSSSCPAFFAQLQDEVHCAGVVHWTPPHNALDLACELVKDKGVSAYGPCAGLPSLTDALKEKLAAENNLPDVRMHLLMAYTCDFLGFK